MAMISKLGDAVHAGGGVSESSFVAGAYAELAVALCHGNERVFCIFAFNYAKVAGNVFMAGDIVQ